LGLVEEKLRLPAADGCFAGLGKDEDERALGAKSNGFGGKKRKRRTDERRARPGISQA
jgi:hypothetical protein